jgi:hypothetical protein
MGKEIISGKIDKVFVKDFGEADQYGNQYGVNVNIAGNWYGMGKKKKPVANVKHNGNWHQLAEGDVIEAVCEVVERNGRTYHNIKSSDVTVKEAGANASSNSSGGSSPNAGSSTAGRVNTGGGDRQDAIMRQSAMGYAAQIIAGTLTSKSDLDQAASDVVRIANEYFLPYAQHGVTEDETRKAEEQELKYQQAAQAADDEQFNDEIPF